MHNQEYYFNLLYTNSAKIQLTFQILPIIVGIWQRKYLNKPLRIFLTFYCCAFLANTLELLFVWAVDNYTSFWLPYIQYWKIDSTNFIAIINYLANFGIMGWYFTLVFKSQTLSNGIKILSFILFLSALINYMFIEGYNVFGIFNPLMDALYSIFIPLIFMWILYNQLESKVPITKNSYFWVNLRFIVPNLIGVLFKFMMLLMILSKNLEIGRKVQKVD